MKKLVILSVVLGLLLGGCTEQKPEEIDDLQIVIFINARSISSPLLKNGTEEETDIEKLVIYGVDADNTVVKKFTVEQQQEGSGIELTISRRIKTFYAIANPSSGMEAQNPVNVSELTDMLADFSSAPQSPFLMSGKADLNNFHARIELVRAVAKIQITGENKFEIQTVTVSDTPDKGYVFDREGTVPPATMTSYPQSDETTFYVAENTKSAPTKFSITGTFEGKTATYDFVIKIDGEDVDILRNTHYKVGISPISDSECSITVEIPDWNEIVTDSYTIPDDNFE